MKTNLKVNSASYWCAVADRLNQIPAVIQFRRTEKYTGKLVREYACDTYRSCPEWLKEPLISAIECVRKEMGAKGLEL